jgi:hypothetical protein
MTGFEDAGVFIREKVWLETSAYKIQTPGNYLAQAIFEPNLFPYKYPNILNPSYSSYLSAYEDGTVFRNAGI